MRSVILILTMLLILTGCSCSPTKNRGLDQPHDQGGGSNALLDFIGPTKAYANGDTTYEIPGNPVIIYDPAGGGESATRVFMGVYQDEFPAHLPASTSLTYFGMCFHNDTVDSANTGMYWSNGATWTMLGSGNGDTSGPGSSIDNEPVRFDGTTGKVMQGGTGWTWGDTGDMVFDDSSTSVFIDTGGAVHIQTDSSSAQAWETQVYGDTIERFSITCDGVIRWGTGSAVDTILSRTAANVLSMATGDSFRITGSAADPGSPSAGEIYYRTDTTELKVWDGSAWDVLNGGGGSSPLTTKGDLYTFSTVDARLGVGTNGYALTPDSAQATGLKYAVPFSLAGDIGTPQSVLIGDTLDIAGGTAIATSAGATDTVTINYDGAISDNSDVNTSGAAADDALIYDGADWVDQTTYYTASFTSAGWTAAGGAFYFRAFTHNLGKQFVNVSVFDNGNIEKQINPADTTTTGNLWRVVATSSTQVTIFAINGNAITGTWNIAATR